MTETIATGLVYIHRLSPTKKFIGCGALIEGPYIATCRHVWRDATNAGQLSEVEIEYPRSRENGATIRTPARLADACENPEGTACDLVLLKPETIPLGPLILQLARDAAREIGSGFALARVMRTDPVRGEIWHDLMATSEINSIVIDNLRQFTGTVPQGFWFTPGSSGSPVFLHNAQQLAGILSLSELGANEGETHLREAFVIPATVIWSFVAKRLAQPIAVQEGIDPHKLQPVLDALGMQDVPIAKIPDRLTQAIAEMRAHAAEPVPKSNDGSDIDATIGASRDKLRALDTQGARDLLQAKIEEEDATHTQRLLRLLKERAEIERIAYDRESEIDTLKEIVSLDPDNSSAWISLGSAHHALGALDKALEAFSNAKLSSKKNENELDLGRSFDHIGSVLVEKGDRQGGLEAFQASLTIAENLVKRDPENADGQRNLTVSQVHVADVLKSRGQVDAALAIYQSAFTVMEGLSSGHPENRHWHRQLALIQGRVGDSMASQGNLAEALRAHREAFAIDERFKGSDSRPGEENWQRALAVGHFKIGCVLEAQGEGKSALTEYRTALELFEALYMLDRSNAELQHDLSVMYKVIGRVLLAHDKYDEALQACRAGLAIANTNRP